jgi:hypothetical protein
MPDEGRQAGRPVPVADVSRELEQGAGAVGEGPNRHAEAWKHHLEQIGERRGGGAVLVGFVLGLPVCEVLTLLEPQINPSSGAACFPGGEPGCVRTASPVA